MLLVKELLKPSLYIYIYTVRTQWISGVRFVDTSQITPLGYHLFTEAKNVTPELVIYLKIKTSWFSVRGGNV